ncbi:MAG: phosphotransferase, partial [Deltaproteobacteria bacterium]
MLSSADLELVRRDLALPGLSIALDPDALRDILRQGLPECDLGAATCTYLRYKPGTSCLAAWRVEVASQPIELYVKAHRLGAHEKLDKAARPTRVAGPLGAGRFVRNELGLAVSLFPNDRRLRAIARLADPARREKLLRELLPDQPSLWKGAVETLRYKPERRYVAHLRTPEGDQAVLRFYAATDFTQLARQPFSSEGTLRVPRRLGLSSPRCAVAWEWLPGRSLGEVIKDAVLPIEAIRRTGAALSALHAQPGDGLRRSSRAAEAASLRAVADGLIALCPALGGRIGAIAGRLIGDLEHEPPAFRPIHGDFYAHQVLVSESLLCLVDFDEAL